MSEHRVTGSGKAPRHPDQETNRRDRDRADLPRGGFRLARRLRPTAAKVLCVAAAGGVALTCSAASVTHGAAMASTTPGTSSYLTEQVQFLAGHQLSDGAILGPGDEINPYFANMAAIGLAQADTPAADTIVYTWMHWYLGHLNAEDDNGLTDTIYDYSYDPSSGAETSTGSYDSVDSYAATALMLAYTGYLTGDSQIQSLVSTNITTYEAIANLDDYPAPAGVRQSDGLTVAIPGGAAYTMDNAEVAAGLSEFAQLEAKLNRSRQSTYYQGWANTTVQAMTKPASAGGLWDAANDNWDWALGSASDPASAFYPDATAQLWPVVFGVVSPASAQATAAWQAFTGAYPSWDTDGIPASAGYPWTSMARAAQLMGDTSGASTLLTTLEDKYAPDWGGNWYDDEAGWFLLAATSTNP